MKVQVDGLIARDVAPLLTSLLADEPAILIEGPRGSGKSTVLRSLSEAKNGLVFDLDDDAVLASLLEDPFSAISQDQLVLVDEFQRAPAVLSAVKRVVDHDHRPARVVLAGSVSGALLPLRTETLTGRVLRLTLPPLSSGEALGTSTRLLQHLLDDAENAGLNRPASLSRQDYFDLIVAGGYPAALRRTTPARRMNWYASYLATVAERDLPELAGIREPALLARLYRAIAQQTSNQVVLTTLAEQLNITRGTVRAYIDLLIGVHLLRELPSWRAGVSAKNTRRPKLQVTDTGLAATAVGMDARRLAASGMAGHFMESYVVNEILKQVAVSDEQFLPAHFRDRSGIEVDLILERPDGAVFCFEVKSATRVNQADGRGLRFLRGVLGDRFRQGFVMHTGPLPYRLDERITALPVSALWSSAGELTNAGSMSY